MHCNARRKRYGDAATMSSQPITGALLSAGTHCQSERLHTPPRPPVPWQRQPPPLCPNPPSAARGPALLQPGCRPACGGRAAT